MSYKKSDKHKVGFRLLKMSTWYFDNFGNMVVIVARNLIYKYNIHQDINLANLIGITELS